MGKIFLLILILLYCISCQNLSNNQPARERIEKYLDQNVRVFGSYAAVKLPIQTGVSIWNPVQITLGPDNKMYVANHTGEIYSLHDTDGDGLEDHAELFCNVAEDGLRAPASIVFKGQDLYVGTAQEVRIYTDTNGDDKADISRVFFDNIPYSEHPYEWTSALTFGPDDHLYLVLTTDSWNAGASPDPEGWRGSILRINPEGDKVERFATGVRSVHSMLFNSHNDLIFNDNQGGGNPTEELNIALEGHFYGHNPVKYENPLITEPIYDLQTEVAPAGMTINPSDNDFDGTAGDLFIAFYGPGERWNRGAIGRLRLHRQSDGSYLIDEFPVVKDLPKLSDLEFGANGDLYATHVGKTDYWYQSFDEKDGAIFRLIHAPWIEPLSMESAQNDRVSVSADIIERGEQLFAERACSACHSVDGKSDLLGPDLKDIGNIYTRQELLEEIIDPSERIKPSMMASRITQKNGEVLLGRVVGSDEERVRLMVIGNRIIDIPRNEIQAEENSVESLMYEGLLQGLSEEDVEALLLYLMQLHQVNEQDG